MATHGRPAVASGDGQVTDNPARNGPEPDVVAFAATARMAGATHALDLQCDVGRHTLALARLGFHVDATDDRDAAVTRTAIVTDGFPVELHHVSAATLPLADASVDITIAWNAIQRGGPHAAENAVAEIARVARPGSRLLVAMPTKRHLAFGTGREVAPDTFLDAPQSHGVSTPVLYCDAEGFAGLFRAFHITTLREDTLGTAGASFWVATLERTM